MFYRVTVLSAILIPGLCPAGSSERKSVTYGRPFVGLPALVSSIHSMHGSPASATGIGRSGATERVWYEMSACSDSIAEACSDETGTPIKNCGKGGAGSSEGGACTFRDYDAGAHQASCTTDSVAVLRDCLALASTERTHGLPGRDAPHLRLLMLLTGRFA